ncbi:DUF6318 family protein [Isoptericola halotolerans]|uniref:DUF6318 family protein n=1 Tax=Isoptericola halotolerans TaxID=300560 RepID=UPI00388EF31C
MPPAAPALGALALVALLLTGCTQPAPAPTGPGTTAEATSSPSPSVTESSPAPSPTPVVVAPERPAAMNDDGHEGAQAAAKYFLSLDDYIMKTGDTTEWEAMSHKECGYCSRRLEQAQLIDKEGYTYHGGKLVAQVLHTYEKDTPTGIWPIDIEVSVDDARVTDSTGRDVFADEASTAKKRIEALRQKDGWVIVGLFTEQTGEQ